METKAERSTDEKAGKPTEVGNASAHNPKRWRPTAAEYFVAIVVVVVLVAVLIPVLSTSSCRGYNSTMCLSNLRQIGNAVRLYCAEHRGVCPPDLGSVARYVGSPTAFVCPASADHAAAGTPEQVAAAINTDPSCCSYVYLGAGKTEQQLSPSFILAYERAPVHPKHVNFLFGDGRVERVSEGEAKAIQAELQAGFNPPRAQNSK